MNLYRVSLLDDHSQNIAYYTRDGKLTSKEELAGKWSYTVANIHLKKFILAGVACSLNMVS